MGERLSQLSQSAPFDRRPMCRRRFEPPPLCLAHTPEQMPDHTTLLAMA